jgi:hypothetical protein
MIISNLYDIIFCLMGVIWSASIAQLGERKTEDLEAPCSIHGRSMRKKIQVLSFNSADGVVVT